MHYDDLNSKVEFDIPFEVVNGEVRGTDINGPSVYFVEGDGPDIEIDSRDDWEPVDGWSGQYRYSGPIMHPSEYLGGAMARYVLENPGIYCVTEVIDMEEDPEESSDPIGWILLKKKEN